MWSDNIEINKRKIISPLTSDAPIYKRINSVLRPDSFPNLPPRDC